MYKQGDQRQTSPLPGLRQKEESKDKRARRPTYEAQIVHFKGRVSVEHMSDTDTSRHASNTKLFVAYIIVIIIVVTIIIIIILFQSCADTTRTLPRHVWETLFKEKIVQPFYVGPKFEAQINYILNK